MNTMKNILRRMIDMAEDTRAGAYGPGGVEPDAVLFWALEIMDELARTCNAPSNWRSIEEEIMRELPRDGHAFDFLAVHGAYFEEEENT